MIDEIHISVLNKYINPDITPGNLCVFSNLSVFTFEYTKYVWINKRNIIIFVKELYPGATCCSIILSLYVINIYNTKAITHNINTKGPVAITPDMIC
jgi:hypothetical protein